MLKYNMNKYTVRGGLPHGRLQWWGFSNNNESQKIRQDQKIS